MNKNHILKFAEKHEFIGDGDLCLAAYFGRLVLGLVEVDPDSQTMFSNTRTVVIKQNQFDGLIAAFHKAIYFFETKSEESFQMDILTKKGTQPLYKLTATFGKPDEATSPTFQLRVMWKYSADSNYLKRVQRGLCEEIQSSSPYIFTKRGVVIDFQNTQEILAILEEMILATYGESDFANMSKVVDFTRQHMQDEVGKKLSNLATMRNKDKLDFVESILTRMKDYNPDYFGNDNYKFDKTKDMVLTKISLFRTLYNLPVDQGLNQF